MPLPEQGLSQVNDVRLDFIKFSTRTKNCILRAQLSTVGELTALRSTDILNWQNAGRKTLFEIRHLFERLGLNLSDDLSSNKDIDWAFVRRLCGQQVAVADSDAEAAIEERADIDFYTAPTETKTSLVAPVSSLNLSKRAQGVIKQRAIKYVAELAQLTVKEIVGLPNVGKTTVIEIERALGKVGLRLGTSISGWSGEQAAIEQKELHSTLQANIEEANGKLLAAISAEPKYVEEELLRFLKASESGRNVEIIQRLWGWAGEPPTTLEVAGNFYGLTRERVRQIEKRARLRLKQRSFKAPLLNSVISQFIARVPCVEATLTLCAKDAGLSQHAFSPQSAELAADILELSWPLEFCWVGGVKVVVRPGQGVVFQRALTALKRTTSERGCVSILALAAEVGFTDTDIPKLIEVFCLIEGVRWLDDEKLWLCWFDSSRNRLVNICSKVLSVAPRIHLSELRRAVSRSRRLAMCPPQRILAALVGLYGLGRVEGSLVLANAGLPSTLAEDSVEAGMIRVLEEFGPVLDGEVFAERCVAAGLNATSFYLYRGASPVICALGSGVYCKVGTDVAPGAVEEIVRIRRSATRISDYGWNQSGHLWYAAQLSRISITSGGISLPAFVSGLTQGEWGVQLPDRSAYGNVTCKDSFVWSFRKQLLLLGAEPGDLALLQFDVKKRLVLIRVGDSGLIESIDSPEIDDTDEADES